MFCLLQKVAYRLNGYMIEEFNMDSKAKCDQLNLTHVAKKNIKGKIKQTNANAHLVQYRFNSE